MKIKLLILLTVLLIAVACEETANIPKIASQEKWLDGFEKIVLDNGLTIFLKEDHTKDKVAMSMGIHLESDKTANGTVKIGINDLFGRMINQGTENRDFKQINEELSQIYSSINIETSKEYIKMDIISDSKNFAKAMEIFFDVAQNPIFPQDLFDVKKNDLIFEIEERYDEPTGYLDDEYYLLLYGNNTYGTFAKKEDIEKIERVDLIGIHKKYFVPKNMFIAVTGNFNSTVILHNIAELAKELPQNITIEISDIKFKNKAKTIEKKAVDSRVKSETLRIGYIIPERIKTEDAVKLNFVSYALSVRLFDELLREGLIYYTSSWASFVRSHNTVEVSAQSGSDLGLVKNITISMIETLKKDGITEKELKNLKTTMISAAKLSGETYEEQSNDMIYNELIGYRISKEDTIKTINTTTKQEIIEIANRHLKNPVIVTLENTEQK